MVSLSLRLVSHNFELEKADRDCLSNYLWWGFQSEECVYVCMFRHGVHQWIRNIQVIKWTRVENASKCSFTHSHLWKALIGIPGKLFGVFFSINDFWKILLVLCLFEMFDLHERQMQVNWKEGCCCCCFFSFSYLPNGKSTLYSFIP